MLTLTGGLAVIWSPLFPPVPRLAALGKEPTIGCCDIHNSRPTDVLNTNHLFKVQQDQLQPS